MGVWLWQTCQGSTATPKRFAKPAARAPSSVPPPLVMKRKGIPAASSAFSALGAAGTVAPPRHDAAAPLRARVADAVRKDRAYAVDAAIVRVMKARRTLPQKRLVADVLRALVHPASDGDVMARVESLVEREYLESSAPGVSNFLP